MGFVNGEGSLRHMLIVVGYSQTYVFAAGEASVDLAMSGAGFGPTPASHPSWVRAGAMPTLRRCCIATQYGIG
jgi:hypothetical protein